MPLLRLFNQQPRRVLPVKRKGKGRIYRQVEKGEEVKEGDGTPVFSLNFFDLCDFAVKNSSYKGKGRI
ncbi:MAG: hypothetical protein LBJ31_01810 [Treponema sp.]|jgi:hypothetical protein|nr:hypothetical protein [Treponema sp.]